MPRIFRAAQLLEKGEGGSEVVGISIVLSVKTKLRAWTFVLCRLSNGR